jgi:hypothetical protein
VKFVATVSVPGGDERELFYIAACEVNFHEIMDWLLSRANVEDKFSIRILTKEES